MHKFMRYSLWPIVFLSACTISHTGAAALKDLLKFSRESVSAKVSWNVPPGVEKSYQLNTDLEMEAIRQYLRSADETTSVETRLTAIGQPKVSLHDALGNALAAFEVFPSAGAGKSFMRFSIGSEEYESTLPDDAFYRYLLHEKQVDEDISINRTAPLKEDKAMKLKAVSKAASQALKWRVEVLGHRTLKDFKYDIFDPVIIEHLAELITSDSELEVFEPVAGASPYVCIDLVYDEAGSSLTKVEVVGKNFFVVGTKHRYRVFLDSLPGEPSCSELFQRLVDKNLVFPKEPVSQRESDVPPDPPPTEVKEGSGVQLESRRDRNDLTLNRRPLPERNAPILDDLPSASPRRNLPPASPTRTRRLGPPQKSVGPGNADRDVPGAVPTLPELPPVRNRHVRRTGPPVVPPLAPPQ